MQYWWAVAFLTFLAATAMAVKLPLTSTRSPASPLNGEPAQFAWQTVTLEGAGTELGHYEVYKSGPEEGEEATSYVVFVPGNPGMCGFYTGYADSLRDRLGCAVIVMGLAGHVGRTAARSLPASERRRVFSLEDQLKHVAARAAVVQAKAADDGVPFTIIGHSIGGWIALRAAQQLGLGGPPAAIVAASAAGNAPSGNTGAGSRASGRPRTSPARTRPQSTSPATPPPPLSPSFSSLSSSPLPEPRVLLLTPFLDVPSSGAALTGKRRLLYLPLFGVGGGSGSGGSGSGERAGSGEAQPAETAGGRRGGRKDSSKASVKQGEDKGRGSGTTAVTSGTRSGNSAAYFAQTGGAPASRPVCFATFAAPLIGYLASAIAALPPPIRASALRSETAELDEEYKEYVVNELAHRHNLRNILYLARTEFAVLEAPIDLDELTPLARADRVRAAYVPKDEWAPLDLMERVRSECGMVAELLEDDDEGGEMKHSFSVQEAQSERMAEWSAKALAQMMLGGGLR